MGHSKMLFIHLAYLSPLFLFPLLSISSTLKRFPGEMSLKMKEGGRRLSWHDLQVKYKTKEGEGVNGRKLFIPSALDVT